MKRHWPNNARWLAIVAIVGLCCPVALRAQIPRPAPPQPQSATAQPASAQPSGAQSPTNQSVYVRPSSSVIPVVSKTALQSVYIRETLPKATAWISDSPAAAPPALAAPAFVPAIVPAARAADRAPQTLWLVSTRRLAQGAQAGAAAQFLPDIWRYVAATGWAASSLDELLRTGSPATVRGIFIHGNDTSPEEAAEDGLALFRQLRASVGPAFEMQCIVWSWPTAPVSGRVRQTAQANANRTNIEGFFLASFLSRIGHESPVSVAGYCSGARVATGALHVLGGGTLEGRQLVLDAATPPRKIHATLLAPAVDNNWLLPGNPHERALSQVERMAITVNAEDPVLRFYPFLWGRKGEPALGLTGIADLGRLGPAQAKVAQLNFGPAIERSHGWQYYSTSPAVIALLRQELLQRPQSLARAQSPLPAR